MSTFVRTTLFCAALVVASACAGDDGDPRTFTDADAGSIDAGSTDTVDGTSDEDGEAPGSDTVNTDMGTEEMGETVICRPNRDGVITRDEVPAQAGLSAKFAVATGVTFDTAGVEEAGTTVWDLSQTFEGESQTLVELRDPAGQWWEASFPTATYFTPLSTTSELFGVFRVTAQAIELLGVVSPEDDFSKTELTYDPPVQVIAFPLQLDATWTVETEVTGFFNGVYSVFWESYVFEVDRSGELRTPYGNFDVLRVRSVLERRVGLLETTIRSFGFVTECFGTVGSIASQENEDGVEFEGVAELRRLTP